jgi:hypothetical protein
MGLYWTTRSYGREEAAFLKFVPLASIKMGLFWIIWNYGREAAAFFNGATSIIN